MFFTLKDVDGDVVSVSSLRELQYWTRLGYAIQGDTYESAVTALGGYDPYRPAPVNPGPAGSNVSIVDNGDGTFSINGI
jgi:hypothetical protein